MWFHEKRLVWTDPPEAPKPAGAVETAEKQDLVKSILTEMLKAGIDKSVIDANDQVSLRTTINGHLARDPDYFTQAQQALIGYPFKEDDLEKAFAIAFTEEALAPLDDYDWGDSEAETAECMGALKPVFDKVFEELGKIKKEAEGKKSAEREKATGTEKLTTFTVSVTTLKDRKDLPATVSASLGTLEGKITAYKTAEDAKTDNDATKYSDVEAKTTAFEAEFKPIFEAYKKAKIDAYTAENAKQTDATKKVDITKLESANDCEAFITELETLEATSTATPPVDPEAEDAENLATDLLTSFGIPKKTVQEYLEKSPFVAMLIGILKMFMPSLFNSAIKNMPESATREVYLNLKDLNWTYKNHKDKDPDWEAHKTAKEKATTFISTEFKDTYNAGRDTGILRSLLNTEYTVADFKDLAKKGDDDKVLEEIDLPKEYITSFPFVEALHKKVMALEGTKTDNDAKTLSAYLAELSPTTPVAEPEAPATSDTSATPEAPVPPAE